MVVVGAETGRLGEHRSGGEGGGGRVGLLPGNGNMHELFSMMGLKSLGEL